MLNFPTRKISRLPSGNVMVQDIDSQTKEDTFVLLKAVDSRYIYTVWENTVEIHMFDKKRPVMKIYLKGLEKKRPDISNPYITLSLSTWLVCMNYTKDWENISLCFNWVDIKIPKITSDVAKDDGEEILKDIENPDENWDIVNWDSFATSVRAVLEPAINASYLARAIITKSMKENKKCAARIASFAIKVKEPEKRCEREI